jgi:hypothetical protein
MDYFMTDDPVTLDYLARVITLARENNQRLRIRTDSENRMQIKRGEGMWTPPFPSMPDQYRDSKYGACQAHTDIHAFNDDCVGFH